MRSLLEAHAHEIEIVGEAADGDEAFMLIQTLQPQLVFLDIQMPQADGFSLLKKFDSISSEVIFVTSFNQYAINAIKFNALDYLLKPVETEDLKIALQKAVSRIKEKQNSQPQIVNLLNNLENESENKKIAIHTAESVKLIEECTIIYVKGDGSYCSVQTLNGERFVTSRYLMEFEEFFGESTNFVRISKSLIINMDQISNYSNGSCCMIEMTNGEVFEVARRRKQEILKILEAK